MKILLDTHIFLWYISNDKRLPKFIEDEVRNLENDVYLSVISLWEITIKYQLNKLPLPKSPEHYVPVQRRKHKILNLDVDEASVQQLIELPAIHRDPFDRLLICQTNEHNMSLATVDGQFEEYSVALLQPNQPEDPEENS